MTKDSLLERQRRAFARFFGESPRLEDMFGTNTFPETYEQLEQKCEEYRAWYRNNTPNYSDVPDNLKLMFKIHNNISGEIESRATLASVLLRRPFNEVLNDALKVRSIPVPIDSFNGAMVYASTIYRGKTQVETGSSFENKVSNFLASIDPSVTMVPGRDHNGSKYDKDILHRGEYLMSAEVSFQVTTNSVIERKSHLRIPEGLTVIMVFGGLGWIERINALERISDPSNGYADCFGPSQDEFKRMREFILKRIRG